MSMTSPKVSLASFLNVPIPASVTTNLRTRQTAGRLPLSARSAHSSEKSGMEPLTRFEGSEMRATQPRYTRDGKWILFTRLASTRTAPGSRARQANRVSMGAIWIREPRLLPRSRSGAARRPRPRPAQRHVQRRPARPVSVLYRERRAHNDSGSRRGRYLLPPETTDQLRTTPAELSARQRSTMDASDKWFTLVNAGRPDLGVKGSRVQISPARPNDPLHPT
jgi:hypothetical protein